MVREVNVRLIGKGLQLLSANGGRFEINQLLFVNYTALVADSNRSCVERRKRKRKNVYSNKKYLILQCLHT